MMDEGGVCLNCVEDAWAPFRCPHCHQQFAATEAPAPLAFDSETYEWQCPVCKDAIQVPVVVDNAAPEDEFLLSDVCYALFYQESPWVPEPQDDSEV
jgi:hypothetical protein